MVLTHWGSRESSQSYAPRVNVNANKRTNRTANRVRRAWRARLISGFRSCSSDVLRKSSAKRVHNPRITIMRPKTPGVLRYWTLPARVEAWSNAPAWVQENKVRRPKKTASISTEDTGRASMKASGILRRLADQRAPVSRCVARKNKAERASEV